MYTFTLTPVLVFERLQGNLHLRKRFKERMFCPWQMLFRIPKCLSAFKNSFLLGRMEGLLSTSILLVKIKKTRPEWLKSSAWKRLIIFCTCSWCLTAPPDTRASFCTDQGCSSEPHTGKGTSTVSQHTFCISMALLNSNTAVKDTNTETFHMENTCLQVTFTIWPNLRNAWTMRPLLPRTV